MRLDERAFCDRGFSRAQLADRLGVSENTLNKWLSPNSEREMPASYDAAWMHAVKSDRLLRLVADQIGVQIMDARDRLMLDLVRWGLGRGNAVEAAA